MKYIPAPFFINTVLPKGAALADWYAGVTAGTPQAAPYAQLPLGDTRADVGLVTSKATSWIDTGTPTAYDTYYLTFDTPVSQPVKDQCGKAVFSDAHLVDTHGDAATAWGTGPVNSCTGPSSLGEDRTANQLALEFLFFDLASCVQDETQPATPIK